jgi:hypothetical protein
VEQEIDMNQKFLLNLWSIGVGSMDAITGLLLIFCPLQVTRLLGVSISSPESIMFLSWIGVFVLGVGLSYGFALAKPNSSETVWHITALTRMLVACFLTLKILNHSLPAAWAWVALSDACVASVQWGLLWSNCFKEVKK